MILLRPKLFVIYLLVRWTAGVMVGLLKIWGAAGRGDPARICIQGVERAGFCETLQKLGGCRREDSAFRERDRRDLLEKNEYLRIANQEIVKLTQSLEAANEDLEKTMEYLDNLIQNSADMIVSTGRGRKITLFNRRAEEVLGHASHEVIGQPVDILFEHGEGERVEQLLRQKPDGKLMEHDVTLRTREGRNIPARLTASLLYARDGELMGSVGACTDLTHLKSLESALVKQQKQLAIAELGGAASHELNQPLTVALGRVQLIFMREGENCSCYQDLLHVERELGRMAEMIRRIGRIKWYKTKPYVGRSQIIDLDRSAIPSTGSTTSGTRAPRGK